MMARNKTNIALAKKSFSEAIPDMLSDNPTQGNPKETWQIWGQKLLTAQLLK